MIGIPKKKLRHLGGAIRRNGVLGCIFAVILAAGIGSASAAKVAPVFTNDTSANTLSFNDTFGHDVVMGSYNPGTGAWMPVGGGGGGAGNFSSLTVSGNATIGGTLGVTGLTTVGPLTATGVLSGAGFTNLFASPPPIGNTTPSTGAFTGISSSGTITGLTGLFSNLAVSGSVSGAGFSAYLASPPPIGSVTPNTGAFTSLAATGATSLAALSASGTVSGAGFSNYFASPPPIGNTAPSTGAFTTLSATGAISGAAFTSLISAPPVGVGSVTPASGAFTTLSATGATSLAALSASGAVTGTGFSNLFRSPPPIGSTAPATGAFTTLSASGAVSGVGFTNLFASPSPIGNTAPNTGAFTTLSASSTLGVTGAVTLSSTLTLAGNLNMNGGIIKSGTEFSGDYINIYAYGSGGWITSQADAAGVAGTFATRTKFWAGGSAVQAGQILWGFADMPTGSGSPAVWAQYSESRKYPGTTGDVQVHENDITTFKTPQTIDPYTTSMTDIAVNLLLQSGGGCAGACYNPLTTLSNLSAASTPANAAAIIGSNSGFYTAGIIVMSTALSGVNGTSTGVYAPALQMGIGQEIEWRGAAGVVGGSITSQTNSATNRARVAFISGALSVAAAGNANPDFQVDTLSSDTSGVVVAGASASQTPGLIAFGTPAALNLGFSTKGGGVLVINGIAGVTCSGTPTASFAATAGLVTHC